MEDASVPRLSNAWTITAGFSAGTHQGSYGSESPHIKSPFVARIAPEAVQRGEKHL